MTKILNSLLVSGTSSISQAVGITAGFVNISNGLSVGTWNKPTNSDFYILSASSSTFPMRIRNYADSKDIIKVYDSGEVEINNGQTSTSVVSLTLGSTSSVNGVGVLQIGSTNSGLRIVGDSNFASFLSSNGDFVFNNTLNTTLNYNSLWIDIGTQSSNIPMISTNTNSIRALRVASGGGNLILSTNYATGTTYSTIDRFIIPGTTSFANPRFVNVGTLQIENIGLSTRNIGTTSNSFPNTLIIGGSSSSINISTTYSIPTSWSQGSILISPSVNINMTASNFPVSGLTHANNTNIIIVGQLTNIPTSGNYNLIIGGVSKITTGNNNVGLGNALSQSNPALGDLTIGSNNVAVGSNAMGKLVSGGSNTAVGDRSLNSTTTTFSGNVGVGFQSGQSVVSSNNIFIGTNAGRSYDGSGDSVLYLSTHAYTANTRSEAGAAHYSSVYATWSGTVPTWASSNNGNVIILGNESSGSRDSSTINSTGTFRSLFFGKGMWHLSTSVNTYVISTSMPTLMTWTSSGPITPNNDSVGSSLELVAGVGRGGGTAGDLYFSTGQLTASGTYSLQNKLNRMTIKGGSGFVGIGPGTFSNSPTTLLHIWGTSSGVIRIQDGTQGSGKVLTSDANGVGTWTTISGGGGVSASGTSNYVPVFTGASSLTNSNIYQGTTGVILIGYTSSSATYTTDTNILRVKGDVYFDNATLTTKKFYLNGTYLFNDVTGNLALGYQALGGNDITSSSYNIGIGYRSLYGLTQGGNYNVGIGYQSLFSNSIGDSNIGIGYRSLYNLLDGSSNISIGVNSLLTATTGSDRIAIGDSSLQNSTATFLIGIGSDSVKNSTNSYNYGIGHSALLANISGQYNIAIGRNSMYNNDSGGSNIAIGHVSLVTQTQSDANIAIGYAALNLNEGNYNIAIGYNTLRSATMSTYNLAVGSNAGQYVGGSYNTIIGHLAMRYSYTSTSNTAIGYSSMYNDDGSTYNIAIGRNSLQRATYSIVGLSSSYIHSSYNIAIGDYSLQYYQGLSSSNTGGCIALGYGSLSNLEVGASNISIGLNAMAIGSYSSFNIAIGNQALYNQGNVSDVSHPLSKYSIAIGYRALYNATQSYLNYAIGYQSLINNTSGNSNLAIGHSSLGSNTTGDYNVAIGAYRPLFSNTTGSYNVALGYQALYSLDNADNNLGLGYQSQYYNISGNRNISLGYRALYGITNSNSNNNIAIGDKSALGFQDGQFNIFLSSTTASSTIGITSGSYNTVIGHNIIFRQNTSNNTIIGNRISVPSGTTGSILLGDGSGNIRILVNSSGYVGIGTQSPSTWLHVNSSTSGAFRLTDTTQGNGRFLVSDSNGVGSWTNSLPLYVGMGLTLSSNSGSYTFSVTSRVSSKSSDFTPGTDEWGYLYNVTTSAALVTVSLPSVSNGFKFQVRKTDSDIGVVQINVLEYTGSLNYTYLTRMNQTAEFTYDGTSWRGVILDDGVMPPSTMLANLGNTFSHMQEIEVIDINDSIQKAINYNQGGLSYDWLSGVMYSSYLPVVVPSSQTSVFATSSNSFIGSTSSPLTLPSYSLATGKALRVQISGTVSGTGSINIYPKIGSVTFSSSLITLGTTNNSPFNIDYTFKVLSIGTTGSIHGSGVWICTGATNNVANLMGTSSYFSNVNTTINNDINFIVAEASSPASMTVIHSIIERLA